mmetsp:Transcript_36915/g.73030  ORF Transcript_36915/g.73030 Transcript_36915/m.73030 type:complete len:347 (-) Transcript_36915:104-1144(-)
MSDRGRIDSTVGAEIGQMVRTASSATSSCQFADPTQTLIFFDWDDTLFPTTAIFDEWEVPSGKELENAILPEVLSKQLVRWCNALLNFLTAACSVSERCVIVTNSRRPWIQQCACRFAPDMLELLESTRGKGSTVACGGSVRIAYANEAVSRKRYRRDGIRPVMQELAPCELELEEQLMKPKQESMRREAEDFYSRYFGQTWKNIISIGDMPYEHNAVQEVTFQRVAPERERLRTKAMTLPTGPSVEEVTFRLELLARLLPALVHHDGDLSIQLDALQDHLQVLATVLDIPELADITLPASAWGHEPQMDDAMERALEEVCNKVSSHIFLLQCKKQEKENLDIIDC